MEKDIRTFMKKEFKYMRVASATVDLKISDTIFNSQEIIKIIEEASKLDVKAIVFPELCITGYTCEDLFYQSELIESSEKALQYILDKTKELSILSVIGMPIRADNQLFNCAICICNGKILGVVPKTFLPNYNEFYERRWFSSSSTRISENIVLCNQRVPFNENMLFRDKESLACFGVEICEDLYVAIPPSSYHCINGANIIMNLSASNETAGKFQYRRDLINMHSSKCISAYVYSSANQTESTTNAVFPGHCIISETGKILKEDIYSENSCFIYADVDLQKISYDRINKNSYMNRAIKNNYEFIDFSLGYSECEKLEREVEKSPFIPMENEKRGQYFKEILNLQAISLAQRLKKVQEANINKAIIAVSGGLDSTLALIVIYEAFKMLKKNSKDILAITMPGFGTTNRTYNNAVDLMKKLNVTSREISIKDACIQHFKDIGHDINNHDVTYENAQARERTQILMDLASKENGIVIGTGDLSELALGWCTYNGDQMSMYGVNAGVPKTVIKLLVKWYAENESNQDIKNALLDIVDTPVSPELLPPDKDGNILQKTELSVGSYDLNDFFLYNMLENKYNPEKIFYLATIAFKDDFSKQEILDTLKKFYKRFFTQQFKRSSMPDGAKVLSISLSPRGDWKMPSDASYNMWIETLNKLG